MSLLDAAIFADQLKNSNRSCSTANQRLLTPLLAHYDPLEHLDDGPLRAGRIYPGDHPLTPGMARSLETATVYCAAATTPARPGLTPRTNTRAPSPRKIVPGEFSIKDWTGYPAGVAKPSGPFRLIYGAEYEAARKAANRANAKFRRDNPAMCAGKQVHEIHPVKYGGSPTDPANKIVLDPKEHALYTNFWNTFQGQLERGPKYGSRSN